MLIKDLYKVNDLVTDKDRTIAQISIDRDHTIFKGHFPGNPVMPGVCMIQIIKELTEEATGNLAKEIQIKHKNIPLEINLKTIK